MATDNTNPEQPGDTTPQQGDQTLGAPDTQNNSTPLIDRNISDIIRDGWNKSKGINVPVLWGATAIAATYAVIAGTSYLRNSLPIETDGIKTTVLIDNEGEDNEKRIEYVSIPRRFTGYTDMRLEQDDSGNRLSHGTSLTYRASELEKKSENALKIEKGKAHTDYETATITTNGIYDKMNEKANDARDKFGWKERPIGRNIGPTESIPHQDHTNLDELERRLNEYLGEN